jgi:hypothetical protein
MGRHGAVGGIIAFVVVLDVLPGAGRWTRRRWGSWRCRYDIDDDDVDVDGNSGSARVGWHRRIAATTSAVAAAEEEEEEKNDDLIPSSPHRPTPDRRPLAADCYFYCFRPTNLSIGG